MGIKCGFVEKIRSAFAPPAPAPAPMSDSKAFHEAFLEACLPHIYPPPNAASAAPLVEKKEESIKFIRTGTAEFRKYSEQKLEPGDQLILSEYPILPAKALDPMEQSKINNQLLQWKAFFNNSQAAPPSASSAPPPNKLLKYVENMDAFKKEITAERKRDKKRRYKAKLKARKQKIGFFVPECKVGEDKLSIEEIKRAMDPVEMEKMQSAFQTKPFIVQ